MNLADERLSLADERLSLADERLNLVDKVQIRLIKRRYYPNIRKLYLKIFQKVRNLFKTLKKAHVT